MQPQGAADAAPLIHYGLCEHNFAHRPSRPAPDRLDFPPRPPGLDIFMRGAMAARMAA
jgi:hypothetical protein